MIGDESEDDGIESLAACDEGEGEGIMEGSVLQGGACTIGFPSSGVIEQ